MAQAQAADCLYIPDGLNLPDEIARPQSLRDKGETSNKLGKNPQLNRYLLSLNRLCNSPDSICAVSKMLKTIGP